MDRFKFDRLEDDKQTISETFRCRQLNDAFRESNSIFQRTLIIIKGNSELHQLDFKVYFSKIRLETLEYKGLMNCHEKSTQYTHFKNREAKRFCCVNISFLDIAFQLILF